jgi:hypothetical protein
MMNNESDARGGVPGRQRLAFGQIIIDGVIAIIGVSVELLG